MQLRNYLNCRGICAVIGIILVQSSSAQYFSLGTDPSSVRWKEIKTDHFKVIYPEDYESNSQHIANGLEYVFNPERRTLGSPDPGQTPFIVHTRSTRSRAFSPYAPRRIEFVTTPPQDFYAQNWIDDIIIHEFRHVSQYAALNKGFTRDLGYAIGQQAIPLVIGLYVPFWFLEGDATIMETTASHSGRGRVANFEMRFKAQVLEKGIYSYEKAVFGSFRDFTPSEYELGYQLVGHSRIRYGPQFTQGVLDQTGRKAYIPVAFSRSLKIQTGLNKYGLYKSISADLEKKWHSEADSIHLSPSVVLKDLSHQNYTCYGKPQALGHDVIAEKSSLDNVMQIVMIDSAGDETTLMVTGRGYVKNSLSVNGNVFCWQENEPDPRWTLQDYMVIKMYDLKTKKTLRLSRRSKFFSPDISPDGNKIVVTEVDGNNTYRLVILDAKSGETLRSISTGDNLFLSHPCWGPDNMTVAAVATGPRGKGIILFNTMTGSFREALPFGYAEVDWPVFHGDHILFVGSYSGTDNIYALDTLTRRVMQVTSVKYGVGNASVSGEDDRLVYLNYGADGFRIETCILDPARWHPVPDSALGNKWYSLAEALAAQENFVYHADSLGKTVHAAHDFRKGLHLFHFHSWSPVSMDLENKSMAPGVTLMSQNLLSNSATNLGWSYDLNERSHRFDFSLTYDGLFPSLSLQSDLSQRKGIINDPAMGHVLTEWSEFNLTGLASIPLTWYRKAWTLAIVPEVGLNFKRVFAGNGSDLPQTEYHMIVPGYKLQFSNTFEKAPRDFMPRWGQYIQAEFHHSPFDELASSIFGIQAFLFLPGLWKHHSLKVYAGYQKKETDSYSFRDIISYPRGYDEIFLEESVSLSGEYAFPICYPDLKLGPVLYIKRIRSAVFYDRIPDPVLWSAGADITADFHLFGIMLPMEAGFRTVYVSGTKQVQLTPLIAINLDSMY